VTDTQGYIGRAEAESYRLATEIPSDQAFGVARASACPVNIPSGSCSISHIMTRTSSVCALIGLPHCVVAG